MNNFFIICSGFLRVVRHMEQLQMSFDYSTPTTPTGLIPGGDGTVKKYYRKAAHRFVHFFNLFLVVKFIIILKRYWFIDRCGICLILRN